MINIVIPMAGRGSRFSKAGYELPKPLLDVRGRPMIEVVVENLRPKEPHRFIFICQKEHLEQYDLEAKLIKSAGANTEIIPINHVTDGAACTVLLAEKFINDENSLMIANCDQYVSVSIDDYLAKMIENQYDGYIMTMTAEDPKWSFVRLNGQNEVIEVVEKKVVSNEATVGIYNYKHGSQFVKAAKEMINANDRVNNEFYVAPAYNYMIREKLRVGYMNIGSDRNGMYGLGVPEDLTYFNSLDQIL
jgi:dTDP-glucose pyrophosphorylase